MLTRDACLTQAAHIKVIKVCRPALGLSKLRGSLGRQEEGPFARLRSLEINEQAARHMVLRGRPRGHRDKKVPGRIVAADFVLDVEDILPL